MRNAVIAISLLAATAASAGEPRHDPQMLPTGLALAQYVFAEPNQIAQFLQNEGYVAKIDKDGDGDPRISSNSQRVKWTVYFYNCSNHTNCQSIQFHSSFTTQGKISIDRVNAWNFQQRFATAVLDKEGDVRLKMDVQLAAGMPEDTFKRNLNVWDSQLGEFLTHIGWR
jgi:hypothetical protein